MGPAIARSHQLWRTFHQPIGMSIARITFPTISSLSNLYSSRASIFRLVYKHASGPLPYLRRHMGSAETQRVTRFTTREDYADFVSKFDTFLLDCDGLSL
jgi:hypothetical protein